MNGILASVRSIKDSISNTSTDIIKNIHHLSTNILSQSSLLSATTPTTAVSSEHVEGLSACVQIIQETLPSSSSKINSSIQHLINYVTTQPSTEGLFIADKRLVLSHNGGTGQTESGRVGCESSDVGAKVTESMLFSDVVNKRNLVKRSKVLDSSSRVSVSREVEGHTNKPEIKKQPQRNSVLGA